MKTVIKKVDVYSFDELSTKAKDNVREIFLETRRSLEDECFIDNCHEYLVECGVVCGGESELNIHYSLSFCQGDGLCFDGKIFFTDVKNKFFQQMTKGFTLEETEIIFNNVDNILLYKINHRYHHVNTVKIMLCIPDMDIEEKYSALFDKLLKRVQEWYEQTCRVLEKEGYEFFYYADDKEVEKWCAYFGYEFTKDGKLYVHES